MPLYFGQTKYQSFQRQLNIYGFLRLTSGPDQGAYYHELFLINRLFLCDNIKRHSIKGTWVKPKASPHTEPYFYVMPTVIPNVDFLGLNRELTCIITSSMEDRGNYSEPEVEANNESLPNVHQPNELLVDSTSLEAITLARRFHDQQAQQRNPSAELNMTSTNPVVAEAEGGFMNVGGEAACIFPQNNEEGSNLNALAFYSSPTGADPEIFASSSGVSDAQKQETEGQDSPDKPHVRNSILSLSSWDLSDTDRMTDFGGDDLDTVFSSH